MNINKFIEIFKEESKNLSVSNKLNNYLDILKKIEGNDWEKHKCKERNGKSYHKEKIFCNKHCDIFIITWFGESVVHDHAENGCIFKLLEGKLGETVYKRINDKLTIINENIYYNNDVGYIENKSGYHKIKNLNKAPSYSINIYSPPKYKCKEIN